jgi:peptide/nickel transport system substrate-binding protein
MKKLRYVVLLLLVMSLFMTGCGGSDKTEDTSSSDATNETPESTEPIEKSAKDTLTIAHWEEPATLDPQYSNMIGWFAVEKQIFSGLVDYVDGEYVPVLAKSWEYIDDQTIRFNLRDDVMFQNGEQMTSEDVFFTLERATLSPKSASTYKTLDIENTKIIDPYTIDVALKIPDSAFLNTLETGRGFIVSKKAVEEMGEAEFARNPVGTGPYQMKEWVSGTEIQLEAFDGYFGEKAKTANVVYKFIPEASNRAIELETGDVDVALNVASNDVSRVQDMENADIVMVPSYRYTTLTMSMQDETLSNKLVREALVYAIDKPLLVEVIYGETAEALDGVMPVNAIDFKAMEATPFDPEKSKTLLAEAGYADGLEIEFQVDPGSEYLDIAEAVQSMWKDVGVTANIVTMDRQSYIAQGHTYQVSIRAGNANHPSNILIIYDSAFGDRIQGNDDYIDSTLVEYRKTVDAAQATQILADLQDYIWDIKYTIPLAHTKTIFGISNNVEGFIPDPLGIVDWSIVTVYE